MKDKLGRNDPCWCGSGRKYKKCHLGRETLQRPNPFQIDSEFRKAFGAKYCLHPEAKQHLCKGNIVRAHSIQRSGGLSAIAENGHVYGFRPSLSRFIETGGECPVELVGLRQASTFTGFCSYHDSETFAPLERHPFQSTDEQCFLLAYRASCRELFQKRAALVSNSLNREMDKGCPEPIQVIIQNQANWEKIALEKSEKDLKLMKQRLDRALLDRDFSHFNSFVVHFDSVPSFLCSGGITPEYDFRGRRIRDLADLNLPLHLVYLSVIPTENGGAAVLSWHRESDPTISQLVSSLRQLHRDAMLDAIGRFAFEHLENVYFAPSWWNGLIEKHRTEIKARSLSGTVRNPRKSGCLLADGIRYQDALVTRIDTNVPDLQ